MPKITKIRDLLPDPKNANKGTERGSGMLEQSLRNYGAGRSILIDKKGRIIAGNKTAEAAGAMGLDKIVVVETDGRTLVAVQRTDLDLEKDAKAKELAVADNRIGDLNLDWDAQALAALVNDGADLTKLFHENELKDILEGEIEDEAPEPQLEAAKELQAKWQTERGQVWGIGKHRLMCGDSTDNGDFNELMNGQKARLVNTDPPYGVNYAAVVASRRNQKKGGWSQFDKDDLVGDDFAAVLEKAFKNAVRNSAADCPFYIWYATGIRAEYLLAMEAAGLIEREHITWVKDSFTFGWSNYLWQTEPCFYAAKQGEALNFYGGRSETTAWRIETKTPNGERTVSIGTGVRLSDGRGAEIFIAMRAPKAKKIRLVRVKPTENVVLTQDSEQSDLWRVSHDKFSNSSQHPTMKPVELAVRAIRNSSLPGEIVLDMFGGAGFTMAGCELTGRACYTMELEPKYVAVILERMAGMNLQPELVSKPALAAHGK